MTPHPLILVVDDDEDVRGMLALVLGSNEYRVALAEDGVEALELLRSGVKPALILLDLRMPRLSGSEVVRYMAHEGLAPGVPVVIISGDGTAAETVVGLGTAGLLLKPVELEELLRLVGRLTAPRAKTEM